MDDNDDDDDDVNRRFGDWQAQFVAGYGLQFGLGCQKNIERAKELYLKASAQGHLVAMNNMYAP